MFDDILCWCTVEHDSSSVRGPSCLGCLGLQIIISWNRKSIHTCICQVTCACHAVSYIYAAIHALHVSFTMTTMCLHMLVPTYVIQNKPYDKCRSLLIAILYNMLLASTYLLPGSCLSLRGSKHNTWHLCYAHPLHIACI